MFYLPFVDFAIGPGVIQGRPQPRPTCPSLPLAFRSSPPFIHSYLVSAPPAAQETQQAATAPALRYSVSARGSKKLTRSERQALGKKQAEGEEPRSPGRTASYVPPGSTLVVLNTSSSAPAFRRAMVTNTTPRTFSSVGAVAAGVHSGDSAVHKVEVEPIAVVCITVNALFM